MLETGGGLIHAEPLIDADPFIAVNSDNLWVDGPGDTLSCSPRTGTTRKWTRCCFWCRSRAPRTIGAWATFTWTVPAGSGDADRSQVAPFVYTGIQMVSKRLLRDAPEGPFSTNILWDRAIEEGRCFGAVHKGYGSTSELRKSISMTEAALENA